MTNGAKTPVASKGRPRANSAACDRTEAVSSTARQRPDAGSQSRHDVLASPPASDRAPAATSRIGSRDLRPSTSARCVRNGGGSIAPSRRA